MAKTNAKNLVVGDSYLFKARITMTEANGAAYAESFAAGKAPKLKVGKSSAGVMGLGFGCWLVNAKNENVLMLKEVSKDNNGAPESVDLTEFIDKANDTYVVTVDRIERNEVFGHIEHMIDSSTQVNLGTASSMSAAIEKRLQEKINEGIVTRDVAERRIEFMRACYATDRDIFMFMDMWVKHMKEPEPEPDCKYQDNFLEESRAAGMDGVILQCLKLCCIGRAVYVESPRGLGKFILTRTVAWLLGLPIYSVIFNRDMSMEIAQGKTMTDNTSSEWLQSDEAKEVSRRALEGDLEAQAQMNLMTARAASVSIIIAKSQFYLAGKDRGLLAIDELNCGDPNIVEACLNPLLDDHRSLSFPGLEENELKFEKPFSLIGTGNSGYEGTATQNKATMSRMATIKLKYPKTLRNVIEASAKAELKRLGYNVNIRKEFMDACESFYNKIYRASSACADSTAGRATPGGQISDTALNIRGFVAALVTCTIFEGSSLRQYLQAGVIDVCDDEETARLMEMLRSCVQASF